jgi:hypothetical protein
LVSLLQLRLVVPAFVEHLNPGVVLDACQGWPVDVMHRYDPNVVRVYFVLLLAHFENVAVDCWFLFVTYTDLVGLLVDCNRLNGEGPDFGYSCVVHVVYSFHLGSVVLDYR